MNKLPPTALLLAALLGLSQCSKKDDPDPIDQLPPATQTGANTFGCLVNGQPWTPKGYNGTGNYSVAVDPTYHGGNIDVRAYRYTDDLLQSIILGGDSINKPGSYSLAASSRSIFFTDMRAPSTCQNFDGSTKQYRRGTLTITRLDLQAGIVSGTFDFVLAKPGCDTIKVTQGRFDKRL
jgi:hypothetical protein